MPNISVGQDELHFQIRSGDLDKTIVFLHSLGTNHLIWNYQVEAFSKMGYTVIVPDIRGHGQSSASDGVSVELWNSDLLRILNHCKTEQAVLCGVSMGGVIAMAFAIKHPERVKALVLADTFAKIEPTVVEEKIKLTAGVAKDQGMIQYAETYLDNTLSATPSAHALRHLLKEAIAGMTIETYTASAECCFRIDLEDHLVKITVPTLVLIGEKDEKTPIAHSETITHTVQAGELHIIPMAKHLSNVDEPEAFNKLVMEFVERSF